MTDCDTKNKVYNWRELCDRMKKAIPELAMFALHWLIPLMIAEIPLVACLASFKQAFSSVTIVIESLQPAHFDSMDE